ncbi:MAG: hypothetical protein IH590_16600 [Aquamicrobium sp.]|nr:hypothetical protein [Aquamicrobium sp.]
MDRGTRNAAIAAALILLGFGVVGYYMPAIMVWLGELSPFAGGAAAALFVLAFFGVFWLRGRSQRRRGE